MKKSDLSIGQSVFVKKNNKEDVWEETITKIGSKYFETSGYKKFEIESGDEYIPNYSADHTAYISMQEIEDEKEIKAIEKDLSDKFRYGSTNLSLAQLREIKKIFAQK